MDINPEVVKNMELAAAEQIAHQVARDPAAEARRRVGASRLDVIFGAVFAVVIIGLIIAWLLF